MKDSHQGCPWCQETTELLASSVEDDLWTIRCQTCGANGPNASSLAEAWDQWDDR
jgi:hypothetical protein